MITDFEEILTNLAGVEASYPIIFWVCLACIIVCTIAWVLETLNALGMNTGSDLAVVWALAETGGIIGAPIAIAAEYGSTLAALATLVVLAAMLVVMRLVVNLVLNGIDLARSMRRRY